MNEMATAIDGESSQPFEALVAACVSDPKRHAELIALLQEDHPLYDQRGAATVARMRGWILLALARAGITDACLLFVLEELDTGKDAYLVAAAARALRSYAHPCEAFAPYVMRALTNVRHDEPVSFDSYDAYAISSKDSSAVSELLATLEWLGPRARGVQPEFELWRNRPGVSRKLSSEIDRVYRAIREANSSAGHDACCRLPEGLGNVLSWAAGGRRSDQEIGRTRFEDHTGARVTFQEFFSNKPTIVAFFYTRCDNPLKCSLTITKLARIQKELETRGLADQIQTAAITYDPGFDLPERLRGYGQSRGLQMDASHRMLRPLEGIGPLRDHFKLGVSFIESLVSRHRVEVYILDRSGRTAVQFQRTHWDEQEVLAEACRVLNESESEAPSIQRRPASTILGAFASVGVAFFPKCPVCWAAYLSLLGIAGIERVPYSPWLQPLLAAVMLANLAFVWLRGRKTERMAGFYLTVAGAITILLSNLRLEWQSGAVIGVGLTIVGSLVSVLASSGSDHTLQGVHRISPGR